MRYKAAYHLNRVYEDVSNKRRDWFWKLAHKLTNEYDVLILEDLNLDGMKWLWGRKVSDLSFAIFLEILQTLAAIKGKVVHFVDRFYPSSKTCSHCGHINKELNLKDRAWNCQNCNTQGIQRDLNAAINLQRVGASTLGLANECGNRGVSPMNNSFKKAMSDFHWKLLLFDPRIPVLIGRVSMSTP